MSKKEQTFTKERSFIAFATKLKELNPRCCIVYDTDSEIPTIYCNCNPKSLSLPENFILAGEATIMRKIFSCDNAYDFYTCIRDDEIANNN